MSKIVNRTYSPVRAAQAGARLVAMVVGALAAVVLVLPVAPAHADHSANHFEDWLPERRCTSPRFIQLRSYATGNVYHRQYYGLGERSFQEKSFSGGWQNRYSSGSVVPTWMPAGLIWGIGARVRSESGATCTQ
jgi:hypothetical protein